jgi:hypothetical protein
VAAVPCKQDEVLSAVRSCDVQAHHLVKYGPGLPDAAALPALVPAFARQVLSGVL